MVPHHLLVHYSMTPFTTISTSYLVSRTYQYVPSLFSQWTVRVHDCSFWDLNWIEPNALLRHLLPCGHLWCNSSSLLSLKAQYTIKMASNLRMNLPDGLNIDGFGIQYANDGWRWLIWSVSNERVSRHVKWWDGRVHEKWCTTHL